ncbi:unnamed protein product [Durusdinium trenchii]|uniref:Uncharacterized protein n=1 Tax=Durusdinium trenchii TaxID=1381693 RepID=A0ABP0HQF6_9DINO
MKNGECSAAALDLWKSKDGRSKLRELMLKNNMDFARVEVDLKRTKSTSVGQRRHSKQIQIQVNHMQSIYEKLENLQGECAVTRSAKPETQKQILSLCAECTKTDVALNNLVLRARTSVCGVGIGQVSTPIYI